MSLLTEGDGFFGTHVVKEDVEEIFRQKYGDDIRFGEEAQFEVVGDGNGYLSRVLKVTPKWVHTNDGIPETFILKIISLQNCRALSETMKESHKDLFTPEQEEEIWNNFTDDIRKFHNRECATYEIFERSGRSKIALMPKIFASKKFDEENKTKGFLAMETVENVQIRHLFDNSSPEQILPVLKALANVVATGLEMSEEDKKSISGFEYVKTMGPLLTDDAIKGLLNGLAKLDEELLGDRAEKLAELGIKLVDLDLLHGLNDKLGLPPVFVHGDLWSTNILWSNEKVDKLIDYQIVHFGNTSEDLVRLFISTLSAADRKHKTDYLLEKYYNYLLDALDGSSVPFTFEKLKESYDAFLPIGAVFMLSMLGPVAQKGMHGKSEEEAVRLRKIIVEKVDGVFDDLTRIFIH